MQMAQSLVPVTVRELSHAEFQTVGPSLSAACAPRFIDFGPTFGKNYDPSDIFLVAFAEPAKRQKDASQPVGFLIAEKRDYDGVVSDVKLVCIQPAYRGRTDAFRLFLELLQRLTLERAGGKEARITLDAIDRNGIRFYERFGFASGSPDYPTQMTTRNLSLSPLSFYSSPLAGAPAKTTDGPSRSPNNSILHFLYRRPEFLSAHRPEFLSAHRPEFLSAHRPAPS
jgi:ribosomal protein S18 acetylase RimI-like enzyme